MATYQLGDLAPQLHASVWIADNATVIGSVIMEADSSVWFGAVVRGDSDTIRIGRGTNIQDNCTLHADPGQPLTIGDNVSIGHQVMLHGCTVGDGTLVGIQSVVLNGARIGKNCIVGACSLVTEGKEFPDGSMIMGSPAKVVRALTPEQIADLQRMAHHYTQNAQRFRAGLTPLA